jgi:hypothetical protein
MQQQHLPTAGLLAIACNTDRFSRRKMLALGMAVIVAALAGLAVVEAQHYAGAREPPYTKALAASTFALSAISSVRGCCCVGGGGVGGLKQNELV